MRVLWPCCKPLVHASSELSSVGVTKEVFSPPTRSLLVKSLDEGDQYHSFSCLPLIGPRRSSNIKAGCKISPRMPISDQESFSYEDCMDSRNRFASNYVQASPWFGTTWHGQTECPCASSCLFQSLAESRLGSCTRNDGRELYSLSSIGTGIDCLSNAVADFSVSGQNCLSYSVTENFVPSVDMICSNPHCAQYCRTAGAGLPRNVRTDCQDLSPCQHSTSAARSCNQDTSRMVSDITSSTSRSAREHSFYFQKFNGFGHIREGKFGRFSEGASDPSASVFTKRFCGRRLPNGGRERSWFGFDVTSETDDWEDGSVPDDASSLTSSACAQRLPSTHPTCVAVSEMQSKRLLAPCGGIRNQSSSLLKDEFVSIDQGKYYVEDVARTNLAVEFQCVRGSLQYPKRVHDGSAAALFT